MRLLILNVFCFLPCFLVPLTLSLNSDGLSLLALKSAIEVDPTGVLNSWSDSDTTPCHWSGVHCTQNRVTELVLQSKGLKGYIPSELGHLTHLTHLILSYNNFSKSIPTPLFNATDLSFLDLSHNHLSGSLPNTVSSLKHLMHLDLSSNSLNGSLPESLSELSELVGTLNLSHNRFSGGVPVSLGKIPVTVSLDLSDNNFTGKIPQVGSILNQGPTAFSGNPGLCGFPLQNACPEAQKVKPVQEVFPGYPQNPEHPGFNGASATQEQGNANEKEKEKERGGMSSFVAVTVISCVLLMAVAVLMAVWVLRRRRRWGSGEGECGKWIMDNDDGVGGEGQKGKFKVVDEGFGLELEDLLRGSAYVVGKSRSGIVYKVVGIGKGPFEVVAVRRLSEGDGGATWRFKEFVSEVEAIGRVHHPNVVPLRAYYYADDEKLLITDFIRNGSLHSALHGGPTNSLSPLSWAARLKIAQGAARGLMYIHEFSGRKYVHGNLKSTKILLDDDLSPYISGFGLTRLGLGTSKSTTLVPKWQNSNQSNSYLAPEVRMTGGKFTQKSDVYSFGIVLLELLTGRLPDLGPENEAKSLESFVRKAFREEHPLSEILDPALLPEVYAKKQVNAAFHVALNCTELDPELRPRMRTVSESLDRIKIQ